VTQSLEHSQRDLALTIHLIAKTALTNEIIASTTASTNGLGASKTADDVHYAKLYIDARRFTDSLKLLKTLKQLPMF